MHYYVYILYSEAFDKYYIGQTNALDLRLERHNEFELTNSYTSKYRPWILVAAVEVGPLRGNALKVERRLKALKSKKIIAGLAQDQIAFDAFAKKVLALNP